MSCPSAAKPLQLSYSNNTVSTDGGAQSNGIAIQIGTPAQLFSLTPSLLLNNTYVNNAATCGNNPNDTCLSVIGGGFESQDSSTFRQASSDSWNGSAEADADSLIGVPALYFNDVLTISASQLLPGFPVLIQTGANVYGGLGLGQNSTFINRLVEAAFAPSRSWSLFTGVYGSIRAGSLMIGGYADRFYTGELHTKNITDNTFCPACFQVSKMVYTGAAGRTTNLLSDESTPLAIYVEPYYPTIIVPDDTLHKFGNVTGGTWYEALQLYEYDANDAPQGNITVTLANGLVTTIPNEALFDPPGYDGGVLAENRNNSAVYGLMQPWTAYSRTQVDNAAVFGIPYAAFVYMIRDYERNTLQIANANQNAQISGDATTICPIKTSKGSGGSSHTGAIAGGVVGGVVGLLLIAALAWFLLRRRKKSAATKQNAAQEKTNNTAAEDSDTTAKPELPTYGAVPGKGAPFTGITHKQEMPADVENTFQEMPAQPNVPTSELPAEGKVVRSELPA